MALRGVAEAHGIGQLAREARLNRENLYRLLSDQGNLQLSSQVALLGALGLQLAVRSKGDAAA